LHELPARETTLPTAPASSPWLPGSVPGTDTRSHCVLERLACPLAWMVTFGLTVVFYRLLSVVPTGLVVESTQLVLVLHSQMSRRL
jgi:hypothetical protein